MCWQAYAEGSFQRKTMKRIGNIYSKIYDLENLRQAHYCAKRDKSHYRAVQMVEADLENRLLLIQEMLKNKTYEVGQYKISIIEDKGKTRLLHKLPYFPDRIIQWAIMLQLEQTFCQVFTNFSCASLKGRGTKYAADLLKKHLRDEEGSKYCLKMDIKKFYPSIDRDILKRMLRKKIKDKDLLWLLDQIIDKESIGPDQENISSEFKKIYFQEGKGLPIGSYLSQYLANFYLAYFDHWLVEEMNCRYVVRYMDDIVILHYDKNFLHKLRVRSQEYLEQWLDLKLKENWQVFPVAARGVDFVGYRHYHHHRLLRKKTKKNMKKSVKAFLKNKNQHTWCSVLSFYGWLKSCNSFFLCRRYYCKAIQDINSYYNDQVRALHKLPHQVIKI